MTNKMNLRVRWTRKTYALIGPKGLNIRLPLSTRGQVSFSCAKPLLTIQDIARSIEEGLEDSYKQQKHSKGQAQVHGICRVDNYGYSGQYLPWGDRADKHLWDGDQILVECLFVAQPPSEAELDNIRSNLRFSLNDRVVCNCGTRWLSGHVVGTAFWDDDGLTPYLVKTDPIPGVPCRTIGVPVDEDNTCVQEVCFNPITQLNLVKAAAQQIAQTKPKLRFNVGDQVAVRIHNNTEDGLEQWVKGTINSIWCKLGGQWWLGDQSGNFPEYVPYKVDLINGTWVFCHRDHFTLIRRDGFQPQTRVKGISKRLEIVQAIDGSKEQIDHQTERRKAFIDDFEDDYFI
jgi:hypothetical protein